MADTKKCTHCQAIKPYDEFPNWQRKDRRERTVSAICKTCNNQKNRAWAKRNPRRHLENSRRWRQNNRDRSNEYVRNWRSQNILQVRRSDRLAAHQRRSLTKTVSKETLDYMKVIEGDPCAYCGDSLGGSIDHIYALAKGGSHDWPNLTGSCPTCNKSKGDKSLLDFLLYQRGRIPLATT